MKLNEMREIISKLATAHRETIENSNTPHETARRFIREVGAETATQCLAAMIRRASWDGRISRAAKDWAKSVALSEEWERRVTETYCDEIHMAHLSQIAEAMPKELEFCAAEVEDEEIEEEPVTITITADEARLILRAVKARKNHFCDPEVINRISNSSGIRKMYQLVANEIEQQITAQGVAI